MTLHDSFEFLKHLISKKVANFFFCLIILVQDIKIIKIFISVVKVLYQFGIWMPNLEFKAMMDFHGEGSGKKSLILRRRRLWTNLLALMYSSKRGRATK